MKASVSGVSAVTATLVGAAGLCLGNPLAQAQGQDRDQGQQSASGSRLEEVVVTARRREESIQKVPIAVTAYSGDQLRQANVVRIESLGNITAGLTISTSNSRNSVPAFAIRGQRNDAAFITNDSSVGIYVAEAVQARMFGLAQSLFDLESVQVLKGPQGTLFGRNTTGGAILFQPQRPTLNRLEGYVQGRAGEYGRADLQGAVSLPLGETAAVRFAVNRTHRDGYVDNEYLGTKLNGENTISARAVLLLQPTERFTNTLYLDYYDADHQGGGATKFTEVNPVSSAQRRFNLLDVLARQNATLDFHDVENELRALSTGSNFGVTNVTQLDLNDTLLLKSILNYRDIEMAELQDLDGTALSVLVTDDRQQTKQYTGELQLQGKHPDKRLNWIVGAYYFREDGKRSTLTSALGAVASPRNGESKSESKSLFAQGDLGLTDVLTLTLGARYTWDNREFGQQLLNPVTGLCTFCATRDAKFTAPTYTVNLSWQIDADHMLYATSRRGYRSGGINSSANTAAALQPFEPEKVTDYEIGFKGDWNLGQADLRTNAAVYYSDYKDIQRTIIVPVNGVPITSIFNAASATITGAELELTFAPVESLELIGTTAWTHARYDKFVEQGPTGPVDRSKNKFSYIPEWTYRAGVRWQLPFVPETAAKTFVRADYSWQGDIYQTDFNAPRNLQEAYGLLSARLDFENVMGSGVNVGLWGTNLLDKEYFTSTGDNFTGVGIVYRGFSEPRTWGIDMRFSF